jgi:7,8-dihydro-6-hydroxymethylpterin-pyrophosphokinase
MRYFLSLGSNINAQKNIELASLELSKILTDLKSSSIHQTKAEGFEIA